MKKITYYEVDWRHDSREGILTLHYASTVDEPGGVHVVDKVSLEELELLTGLLRKHPKVMLNPETGNMSFDKHKVGDD